MSSGYELNDLVVSDPSGSVDSLSFVGANEVLGIVAAEAQQLDTDDGLPSKGWKKNYITGENARLDGRVAEIKPVGERRSDKFFKKAMEGLDRNVFVAKAETFWEAAFDEQENLSSQDLLLRQSWFGRSVLAVAGRDFSRLDGEFMLHSEIVYSQMIYELVTRLKADPRNARSIKLSHKLDPVEKNSSCSLHPYGRIVVVCECQRLIGRAMPKLYTGEGCTCTPFTRTYFRPRVSHYQQQITCVLPHVVDSAGLCCTGRGLNRRLSLVSDNLPMFAKLARTLFKTANNQYIVREVLGGPYSGYLQVAVMLAFRLSVSDCVRVVTGRLLAGFVDDVPLYDEASQEQFYHGLVALRSQGNYRGWMNNVVLNAKRVIVGDPLLSDEQYRDTYKYWDSTDVSVACDAPGLGIALGDDVCDEPYARDIHIDSNNYQEIKALVQQHKEMFISSVVYNKLLDSQTPSDVLAVTGLCNALGSSKDPGIVGRMTVDAFKLAGFTAPMSDIEVFHVRQFVDMYNENTSSVKGKLSICNLRGAPYDDTIAKEIDGWTNHWYQLRDNLRRRSELDVDINSVLCIWCLAAMHLSMPDDTGYNSKLLRSYEMFVMRSCKVPVVFNGEERPPEVRVAVQHKAVVPKPVKQSLFSVKSKPKTKAQIALSEQLAQEEAYNAYAGFS